MNGCLMRLGVRKRTENQLPGPDITWSRNPDDPCGARGRAWRSGKPTLTDSVGRGLHHFVRGSLTK